MPAGRSVVAVSVANSSTCAILDDGQLRCWGRNAEGQLGQGNTAAYGDDPGEHTEPVTLDGPVRAVALGDYNAPTCAVTVSGLRCWGPNAVGQLGQGSSTGFGTSPGEVPTALPPINLGGQSVGRDSDGDGVRDAVDACPTTPGTLSNGCAPPPVAPTPAAAEARLKGRKVLIDTVLALSTSSATCPRTAKVLVKTKGAKGRISVVKQLKSKAETGGCRVKGKVKLPSRPTRNARVKVTVTGKKLRTRHLVAVRP